MSASNTDHESLVNKIAQVLIELGQLDMNSFILQRITNESMPGRPANLNDANAKLTFKVENSILIFDVVMLASRRVKPWMGSSGSRMNMDIRFCEKGISKTRHSISWL